MARSQGSAAGRGFAAQRGRSAPVLPEAISLFLRRLGWRLLGVALWIVAAAFAAALVSYSPSDAAYSFVATSDPVGNWLGAFGANVAAPSLECFGLGAAILILPIAAWGWRIASLRGLPRFGRNLLCVPPAIILWSLFWASLPLPAGLGSLESGFGGFIGERVLGMLADLFITVGIPHFPEWVLALPLLALAAACLYMTLGLSQEEIGVAARGIKTATGGVAGGVVSGVRAVARARIEPGESLRPRPRADDDLPWDEADETYEPAPAPRRAERTVAPAPFEAPVEAAPRVAKREAPKPSARAERERQGMLNLGAGDFLLPSLALLAEPPPAVAKMTPQALEQNARLLEGVLDDFGVKGEIQAVHPGPVVTLYELEPAPGIKSSRVIGLADDIARSMSAISARVAVVPGRNAIGIELPNSIREAVALKEILGSRDYDKVKASLPLAMGKDIGGAPIVADLATMPHMLVAGTTGSGKSVAMNVMILSLLYRLSPKQLRFIMVDPKMLELSVYDGIPHLLAPVVTEPKKAVVALKWAVREMEDRYRAMSKLGVRNISAYNQRVDEAVQKGETLKRRVQVGFDRETGQPKYEDQEFDFQTLPQIVIIIDEMADLMLVAGKDVEGLVQRLAQMARAAGIHMIMATQRPSVDVITGTIKANFPVRVSFQVTSKIDSRTILGEQGAEQLLGKGDMLYMAGGGRITRVHGPFVSDEEVERVVAHLKTQGAPDYLEAVTEDPDEGFDEGAIDAIMDEADGALLYDKAVDIVLRDGKASTSYIQRRLKIGYNRAANLIEQMEEEGVISAPNAAGKREILGRRPNE